MRRQRRQEAGTALTAPAKPCRTHETPPSMARRVPTDLFFEVPFYQIASKIPSLVEAVEAEAKRRQAENLERAAKEK